MYLAIKRILYGMEARDGIVQDDALGVVEVSKRMWDTTRKQTYRTQSDSPRTE